MNNVLDAHEWIGQQLGANGAWHRDWFERGDGVANVVVFRVHR